MQQRPEICPGFLCPVRMSSSPRNVSTLQGRPPGAGNVSAGCRCLLNKPISPNSRVFPPHTALTSPSTHIHQTGGAGPRIVVLAMQQRPQTVVPTNLPQQGQHFLHRGFVSSSTSDFQNTLPLSPMLTLHPPEGTIPSKYRRFSALLVRTAPSPLAWLRCPRVTTSGTAVWSRVVGPYAYYLKKHEEIETK